MTLIEALSINTNRRIADSMTATSDRTLKLMHATFSKTRIAAQLACFSAVLAVSACATFKADEPAATHPVTNGSNNPVFAESLEKTTAAKAPRDLATLIFYRPGNSGSDAPVNVYVNGRFLSSLLPGGYVEHSNCTGSMQVAAVFDDARIRHLGQRGQETTLPVEAGKTYYLQVDTRGTAKQATLVPVEADQVFLGQYRRQSHVLARAPTCGTTPEVAAAPAMAAVPLTTSAVGIPVAAPMLAADSVRAPLESWRAAWERGDYTAYTSFYAPEFKGALKSHKAWLDQRRARLNNTAKQVGVKDLSVSTAGDKVITDFAQIYHSTKFNDDGQKRLVWKQYGNQLKIVEEAFSPKK